MFYNKNLAMIKNNFFNLNKNEFYTKYIFKKCKIYNHKLLYLLVASN